MCLLYAMDKTCDLHIVCPVLSSLLYIKGRSAKRLVLLVIPMMSYKRRVTMLYLFGVEVTCLKGALLNALRLPLNMGDPLTGIACLTGAAHLSNANAGVLRSAQ
jgi:hypothetical protein